jgi:hypothetical protein
MSTQILPVCRVNELAIQLPEQSWLIESIWGYAAVGMIGGPPKCCKSWFGLDMAVSVASGTPCLDRFPVKQPDPVLIFLAEDALPAVRSRIEALCAHRHIHLDGLNLYVITASSLRLDLGRDQQRLKATLEVLKPRFLLLDPLIRLHRLDENSAADISNLLGFVREIQRAYDMAVVLVHHASKKRRAQPGQALRGSSDLHAFGDSNAYLTPRNDSILLTIEHRSAKPPEPVELKLVSSDAAIHLAIAAPDNLHNPLPDRIMTLLTNENKPLTQTIMRDRLKVNNQRLSQTLNRLDQQGLILRTSGGWVNSDPRVPCSLTA